VRRLLPGLGFLVFCLLLIGLALAPGIAWRLMPPHPLGVLVVNKTVPDTTYRGHRAFIWVLDHLKIVHPGSLAPYDAATDYAGFVPLTNRAWSVRDFPSALRADRVVYLADTYGVREGDLDMGGSAAGGGRLLFGGLSMADLETLERAAGRGVTIIAEFNTAADPTTDTVRARAEALFGFRWTGWTGRRSVALDLDYPAWARTAWEQQSGGPWSFNGPGFLLAHRDGRVVVLSAQDLEGVGLRFDPSPAGVALGMRTATAPQGWFDLVEPAGGEVLGSYHWELTARGDSLFAAAGLPLTAAAALAHRRGASRTWYLAGDFANMARTPDWTRQRWGAALFRLLPEWWLPPGERFFWRAYLPLLTTILDQAAGSS
jgi:hypothetical protein